MPTDLGPVDLTNNTSHSPFVTSASTVANPSFQEWMAFNGNPADGWGGSNSGVDWLKVDLGSAQLLGSYSIQKIATQAYIVKDWTMEGSNDNSTWDVVDTRSGEDAWAPSETRTYVCAVHTTPYRYFRLNITANTGGAYTMIAELRLYSETAGIPPQTGPLVELSPHDLTSNTSHPPFVVTALNEYYGGFNAFAGSPYQSWLSTVLPAWLQIDLGTAKVLGRYKITAAANSGRIPKDWTMEASNDGASWDVVDTRAGELLSTGETRAYYCAVLTTAYRYFRLHVTAEQGTETIAQINSLSLYEAPAPALTAQTITFPAIPDHANTDAPFTLAATSDSGLAVSYAVTSGPATVSGNTVTLTGATGSVAIRATQAGNGTYSAAPPVDRTFAVTALTSQTITFPTISDRAANDPPFALLATSDSGLTVAYSIVSGSATISGNTVTLIGTGVVAIRATQAGNGTYAPATPVVNSFTVKPAQRGYLDYDQIRSSARTGNGHQLLTYTDPPPTSASSPGTPGQVAFDGAGYWYWCYAVNAWARIGPEGYGSAAASPPSW